MVTDQDHFAPTLRAWVTMRCRSTVPHMPASSTTTTSLAPMVVSVNRRGTV